MPDGSRASWWTDRRGRACLAVHSEHGGAEPGGTLDSGCRQNSARRDSRREAWPVVRGRRRRAEELGGRDLRRGRLKKTVIRMQLNLSEHTCLAVWEEKILNAVSLGY